MAQPLQSSIIMQIISHEGASVSPLEASDTKKVEQNEKTSNCKVEPVPLCELPH